MRGGAERIVRRIAEGFKEKGHEVLVITARPKDFVTGVEVKKGIKIYNFNPFNIFFYTNDYKNIIPKRLVWHFLDMLNHHSMIKVRKILAREKPDVVITHNLKGIGLMIPRAIKKLGIKHFHTLHDVQLSAPSGLINKGEEKSWRQRTVFKKLYEIICRWLFDSPDVVISPSQWLLDFYSKKGFFKDSQKVFLPNPIFTSVDEINKLDSDRFRFTFIGQIEKHKGILFLIKVFKELKSQNIVLNIVGNGSLLSGAKFLAEGDKRIRFIGMASQDELRQTFRRTDATIVPSLCYENSPGAIYDSFVFKTPVIASNIGGVAELVKEGERGLVFEAGNKQELKEKIKYCLDNKQEVREMGKNAQNFIKNYSLDNYLKKLEEFI